MQRGEDPDLATVHAAVAALAHSMRDAPDPLRFFEGVSARLHGLMPHDRLLLALLEEGGRALSVFGMPAADGPVRQGGSTISCYRERRYSSGELGHPGLFEGKIVLVQDATGPPGIGGTDIVRCPLTDGLRAWLVLPLHGAESVSGGLIFGSLSPSVYTQAHVAMGRRIAGLLGPLLEAVALLHKERHRRRRLAVLPDVARAVGTSLDVGHVFGQLGAAVRPVLDFDVMLARLIGPTGAFEPRQLWVGDRPDELPSGAPDARPEDYSFSGRILAREPVLLRDAREELDPGLPGDRSMLDCGARSIMVVPLVFAEHVGGVLALGKRRPDWFDEGDVEVATGIAIHVVVAIQHQRLAEAERRRTDIEGRALQLERHVARLQGALSERHRFDRIIGQAPSFRDAIDRAARVAPEETTVLLAGESGTGKELVARAIHHSSRRAEGPFVAVNCAALPETLIESELFGHERGAFTGADKLKRGRFELATGGTLFLDEVGELAPAVQAKLLRVLQERQYQRIGGTATLTADARVIAATNRDLEHAVSVGRYRDDLYYRLAVFSIRLPALRDRMDDVPILAEHFLRELASRMGRTAVGLSLEARDLLIRHQWPGNIRELQNAIERALILCDGDRISAGHLGIVGPPPAAVAASGGEAVDASARALRPLAVLERDSIAEALRRTKGNKSRAAAALGLSRTQFYTRFRRLGLAAQF